MPGDAVRILIEGMSRAEIAEFLQEEPYFMAEVCEKAYIVEKQNSREMEALTRNLISTFEEYVNLNNKMNPEILNGIIEVKNAGELADIISGNIALSV